MSVSDSLSAANLSKLEIKTSSPLRRMHGSTGKDNSLFLASEIRGDFT